MPVKVHCENRLLLDKIMPENWRLIFFTYSYPQRNALQEHTVSEVGLGYSETKQNIIQSTTVRVCSRRTRNHNRCYCIVYRCCCHRRSPTHLLLQRETQVQKLSRIWKRFRLCLS